MAPLELSEQELTLALEEALAESSAAIDRLERLVELWKGNNVGNQFGGLIECNDWRPDNNISAAIVS